MTTYYVNRTSGLDANDGLTTSTAWQNISKVAAGIVSGDIVNFNRGDTWQRAATITFVGGATYQAYGTGANPIIEGADLWAGAWTLQAGSVFKQLAVTTVDSASGLLWEDGVKGTRMTSIVAIVAAGQYFLDDAADTLYYWSRTGVGGDPTGRRVLVANNNSPFQMTGGNGALTNITFRYAAGTALSGGAAGMLDGWVITNCRFSGGRVHCHSQFVAPVGTSITFVGCEFDNAGQYGCLWLVGCNNSLWQSCTFHDNTVTGISIDGTGDPSGNVIQFCTAYNNGQDGIALASSTRSDIIEYCTAYGNGQTTNDRTGIKSFGNGSIIRYCDSYSNATNFAQGHGYQFDSTTTIFSRNGIIHHCRAWDNTNGGISVTGNCHQLYNNTLANNRMGGINLFTIGSTVTGLIVKNNVISNNGNAANLDNSFQRYCFSDGANLMAAGAATSVFDYNDLNKFSSGQTVMIRWANSDYSSVAAFKAAVATQMQHGIEADPLFANGSTNSFALQTSSPAKDTGISVPGFTDGFSGSAPDMGAFEFVPNSPANFAQGFTVEKNRVFTQRLRAPYWVQAGHVRDPDTGTDTRDVLG